MKKALFLIILWIYLTNISSAISFSIIKGMEKVDFYLISSDKNLITTSSKNALFVSKDKGKHWKKIKVFDTGTINALYVNEGKIYVGVGGKVFLKENKKTFTVIFRDISKITFIKKINNILFIGTQKGLFYAHKNNLFKRINLLPQTRIWDILIQEDNWLVNTDKGVYLGNLNKGFKRTLVLINEYEKRYDEDEETIELPYIIKKDIYNCNVIYCLNPQGLFISLDKGLHWRKSFVNSYIKNIRFFLQDTNPPYTLLISSSQGLYKVNLFSQKITPLYKGLGSQDIRFFVNVDNKHLILCTSQGLFESENKNFLQNTDFKSYPLSFDEPSIQEVIQATIEYNEISPQKIKAWRKQSRLRALLPQVSLNYSKSIWGTSGGASYEGKAFVGPRDWSITLSWDIGDLIWDSSQTDIDTRSRLNTQLRLDILEEVNRIYFERKRLIEELLNTPPQNTQEITEKKLRIEELTSALDYYTGGLFSKKAKRLKLENTPINQ